MVAFGRERVRRLTTALVMLGLLMAGPGAPRLVSAQVDSAQRVEREADRTRAAALALMSSLRSLRADLDRTRIDVEELSFELAFEGAEGVVAFVRDEIAFEQYPGLLRGGEGTLVDGAGNALDQALLLALLLGDSGQDVRIASGRLSIEQAERLLRSMAPGGARDGDGALARSAGRFSDEIGLSADGLSAATAAVTQGMTDLRAEADAAALFVSSRVVEAGIPLGGAAVDDLVEEARDYYWVEYGLNDEWRAAHVAFADGDDVEVEAIGYLDGAVPTELQHRFRLEVLIEQRLGHELLVKPVTAAWERPVANMHGLALTYMNLPDGVMADVELDMAAVLEQTTFFVPVFEHTIAAGAQSFDLDGNSVSPDDAANPAAGVVRTVGGLFGGAAGGLAGERDPDDFVALTAQWIVYTLIAPGGRESVHRRTVFDRIGSANREAGLIELDPDVTAADAARALATSYSFMVAPGRYSEAYVLDRGIAASLASGDVIEASLGMFDDAAAPAPSASAEYATMSSTMEHLNLYAAFDAHIESDDLLAYRAEPSLVVVERGWAGTTASVDVVSNRRRVLRAVDGELPRFDAQGAILIGAWETRVEGLPVAMPGAELHSVYRTVAEARTAGIPFDVLAPLAVDAVESLDLPHASLDAIRDDLAAGYAVVAPRSTPPGAAHVGWWRIDPATGETLGRGGDGRGQTLAEYEEMVRMEAFLMKVGFGIGAGQAAAGCSGKRGNALACCLVEGALIAGVMVGVGAVVGATFGASALFLFVALDVGVGSAMMFGSVLDVLPSACSGFAGLCLEQPTG